MLSRQSRRILYVISFLIWIGLLFLTYSVISRRVHRVNQYATSTEQTSRDTIRDHKDFTIKKTRSRSSSLWKAKGAKPQRENDVDGNGCSDSDSWRTPESVFAERRRRVLDICANEPEIQTGWVKGVFTHRPSGVIYCFVPKAGCTFWKRVFYVANQENATAYSVFNSSRNLIHALSKNGRPYRRQKHGWSHFPTRFTVARDPFSRLLSSYLDKAYLPNFWSSEILWIARRQKVDNITASDSDGDFLRSHFDDMAAMFDQNFEGSSTSKDKSCGKYVTFAEFVRGGFGRREPHWMPLSDICNPCKFNVTHISYMETFTQDARAMLDHMGVAGLLDQLDKDTQVNQEMKMIVDYYFYKWENFKHVKRCSTTQEIAYRLWNNFRWRGYIDPEIDYVPPDEEDPQKVKENLESQLTVARVSGLKNRARLKAAKEEFYQKTYLTLSKEMFEKLLEKYNLDFKFYGYEEKRDKLSSLFQLKK